MPKLKLIAALTLITMFVISCKKSNDTTSPVACTNNTVWVSNRHKLTYVNDPILISADSLYITMQDLGSGVFRSTSQFDNGTTYPTSSSFMQPCGNSIYSDTAADMAHKQEAYRLDGNIGDTWSYTATSQLGNTITVTSTITAKNVSVTVPAGTFSTLQIHQVTHSNNPLQPDTNLDTYMDAHYGPVKVLGDYLSYRLAYANF